MDPDFFQLIRLPLVAGDPATVFRQPNSVVLSQSRHGNISATPIRSARPSSPAGAIAPRTDTACETTTVSLKVTGVMRDLPHNTQLTGDVFFPNTSIADRIAARYEASLVRVTMAGALSAWRRAPILRMVIASMAPMLDRAVAPELRKFGIPARGSQVYGVHLTPFSQVHLSSVWLFAQHDAAGKLDDGLWRHRHRRADPAGRLLQFHESGHGPGHAAGAGNRAAQDRGRQPRASWSSSSWAKRC